MRRHPKLPCLWIGLFAVLAAGCGGSDGPSVDLGSREAPIEDVRGYVDDLADRILADAHTTTEEAKQRLESESRVPAQTEGEDLSPEEQAPAEAPPEGSAPPGSE